MCGFCKLSTPLSDFPQGRGRSWKTSSRQKPKQENNLDVVALTFTLVYFGKPDFLFLILFQKKKPQIFLSLFVLKKSSLKLSRCILKVSLKSDTVSPVLDTPCQGLTLEKDWRLLTTKDPLSYELFHTTWRFHLVSFISKHFLILYSQPCCLLSRRTHWWLSSLDPSSTARSSPTREGAPALLVWGQEQLTPTAAEFNPTANRGGGAGRRLSPNFLLPPLPPFFLNLNYSF